MTSKNVTILTLNDNSQLIHSIAKNNIHIGVYSCAAIHTTPFFNYDILSLNADPNKLFPYLQLRDGLIIIIENKNDDIITTINQILKQNKNKPILIIDQTNKFTLEYNEDNIKMITIMNDIDFVHLSKAQNWFDIKINFTNRIEMPNSKIHDININNFAKDFEENTMPIHLWNTYGRLKIVYYAILKYGFQNSLDNNGWLFTNWRKYKQSIGHGHLWNVTLTSFYVKLLNKLITNNNYKLNNVDFDKLIYNYSFILNGKLFMQYYSDSLLFSEKAKTSWVEPDLKQI